MLVVARNNLHRLKDPFNFKLVLFWGPFWGPFWEYPMDTGELHIWRLVFWRTIILLAPSLVVQRGKSDKMQGLVCRQGVVVLGGCFHMWAPQLQRLFLLVALSRKMLMRLVLVRGRVILQKQINESKIFAVWMSIVTISFFLQCYSAMMSLQL